MLKKAVRLFVVIAIATIFSTPAWAAKGLRIGTGLGIASFPAFDGDVLEGMDLQSGITWDMFEIGYGFTDALSLNFKLIGAAGDVDASGDLEDEFGGDADLTWVFVEYAFDLRYAFMTDKAFNPYVMLGFGFISGLQIEGEIGKEDVEITTDPAVGFDVGGGLDYYLGQEKHWSLGTQVYYHMVNYTGGEVDVEGHTEDLEGDINGGIVMWAFTVSYTFHK